MGWSSRVVALLVVLLALSMSSCSHAAPRRATAPPSSTSESKRAVRPDTDAHRYDLDVSFDLARHQIAVEESDRSSRPRSRIYLHPALAIETLRDELGPIPFQRSERIVDLARRSSAIELRYRGRLPGEGTNDTKARPYVETGRVRLTEVTLWYPVFYEGPESFPWPPEAAVGTVRVQGDAALQWASSGERSSATTFRFVRPSSFTLVGVTTAPQMTTLLDGRLRLETFGDAGPSFARQLGTILERHSQRLGAPRVPAVSVVVFPTPEATNALGFLSDSLVMLNTRFTQRLIGGERQATWDLAHEFAHLWFGADLRPSGAATLWLAEGFAEYYAWRALRDLEGALAYDACSATARQKLGNDTPRLDALAVGDRRVYWIGPLALDHLGTVVGEDRLDGAIHAIHGESEAWSVETLMRALATRGADPVVLAAFRERWGL
jgi:hypothetical protein